MPMVATRRGSSALVRHITALFPASRAILVAHLWLRVLGGFMIAVLIRPRHGQSPLFVNAISVLGVCWCPR